MFGSPGRIINESHAIDITVTQGLQDIGGGFFQYGYYDGNATNLLPGYTAIGSVSPTLYRGASIECINATLNPASNDNFLVMFPGNLPQGFFSSVTFPGAAAKTSASASHSYNATDDSTSWSWIEEPLPSEWDGTGDLTVLIR